MRPALERGGEGILHRVLGELEVAEDAGEDGHRMAPFLPEGTRNRVCQCSITGLSSTEARSTTGIFVASAIAWSRSSQSSTKKPPICSFVSA